MSGADTSVPTSPAIEVCKIGGLAGVEILGVDLSRGLDESTFKAIEDMNNRHPVVVMRDQKMTPAQHVAFSRRFGELEIHVLKQYLVPRHPKILVISSIVDEKGNFIGLADGGRVCVWHTDMSYLE